jgi:hypothetical protein
MKPIGKVVISPVEKKRRRARRVADSMRDVLDLYERYEDVRKHGGTSLDELTRKIEAREASERKHAAVSRAH